MGARWGSRLRVLLAVLVLGTAPLPVSAEPTVADDATAVPVCTVRDPRLEELSGLVSDGRRWYAMPDGGSSSRVYVLGRGSCDVREVISAPLDPYDVEDLALARDGAFWLADTGDNDEDRRTVALIRLTRSGDTTLYRLTYPDGPHDAEALLLSHGGVPYIVTKSISGAAGVYAPARKLRSPGPTPLKQVANVNLRSTDTQGGPVPGIVGSVTVTGGAVSRSGTVIALRTYTECYLYRAPGGNIVRGLASDPVRIPLPQEVQGEAIAVEPNGTVLSAGEGQDQPVRAVRGAVALLPAVEPGDEGGAGSGAVDGPGLDTGAAVIVTAIVLVVVFLLIGGARRLRARRRR